MHCSVYSIYTIHSLGSTLAKKDIMLPLPYAGTWDIPKTNPGKKRRQHPGHLPDVNCWDHKCGVHSKRGTSPKLQTQHKNPNSRKDEFLNTLK